MSKSLKTFLLAILSGFICASCVAAALGHQNSPYQAYAAFFGVLAMVLGFIALAQAEKNGK